MAPVSFSKSPFALFSLPRHTAKRATDKARTNSARPTAKFGTKMTQTCQYDPVQMQLMEERIILVDHSDNPIGQASKYDAHRNSNIRNGMLHRAFSLFLFARDRGENCFRLLLQQRSSKKITFPGMLTNTCCSHPWNTPDELDGILGCKRAAARKVRHELGVSTILPPDLTFYGRIRYSAPSCNEWGENEIDYLLVGAYDNMEEAERAVHPNENEVQATIWVNQQELDQMMSARGEPKFTPWFSMIHKSGILGRIWAELEDSNGKLREQEEGKIHRLE